MFWTRSGCLLREYKKSKIPNQNILFSITYTGCKQLLFCCVSNPQKQIRHYKFLEELDALVTLYVMERRRLSNV